MTLERVRKLKEICAPFYPTLGRKPLCNSAGPMPAVSVDSRWRITNNALKEGTSWRNGSASLIRPDGCYSFGPRCAVAVLVDPVFLTLIGHAVATGNLSGGTGLVAGTGQRSVTEGFRPVAPSVGVPLVELIISTGMAQPQIQLLHLES